MSSDDLSLGGAPCGAVGGALREALYEKSLDCVHCGLCLTSCPTYLATGRETSSPRGRIYLMRGLAEGRLESSELLEEEAFLCLGCRACETACPSGVEYGQMLEQTRAIVRSSQEKLGLAEWIERFALREIVPKPGRLKVMVGLLAIVQKLRLDRLATKVLPARLAEMTALLPQIPSASERKRMPAFTSAVGERKGRVALFEGCVMPEFFGRVNEASRLVLSRAGYDVIVPQNQGCCGALQAHSGDLDFARGLAEKNLGAFGGEADVGKGIELAGGAGGELGEIDAIIVTSAGCSAAFREAEHWLGEAGATLSNGVRDILEFLDEIDLDLQRDLEMTPIAQSICYDDPCHLIHAQGIAAGPRRLLEAIPGLKLIPHANPEACCGAAGIYNLTQPEMSKRVLSPKLDSLIAAGPDLVATANPGCAMQLESGLRLRGLPTRVVHPIELLEEATRPATKA